MKKEQFDESVNRALYQASRNLELNETLRYLEKDVIQLEHVRVNPMMEQFSRATSILLLVKMVRCIHHLS